MFARVAVKIGENEPKNYPKRIHRNLDIVDIVKGDTLGYDADKIFLPVVVDISTLGDEQFIRLRSILTQGNEQFKRIYHFKEIVYKTIRFDEFLDMVFSKTTGKPLREEWVHS
jgi:hypothetical protein